MNGKEQINRQWNAGTRADKRKTMTRLEKRNEVKSRGEVCVGVCPCVCACVCVCACARVCVVHYIGTRILSAAEWWRSYMLAHGNG